MRPPEIANLWFQTTFDIAKNDVSASNKKKFFLKNPKEIEKKKQFSNISRIVENVEDLNFQYVQERTE